MPPPEQKLATSRFKTDACDSATNERQPSKLCADSWKPSKEDWPKLKDLSGSNLPTSALIVFAALTNYANPSADKWPLGTTPCRGFAAWPSVHTLIQCTGLSERGVRLALRMLETQQVIQCIRRSKGGGFHKGESQSNGTSVYLLTPHMRRDAVLTRHCVATEIVGARQSVPPHGTVTRQMARCHTAIIAPPPGTHFLSQGALTAPELVTLHHHQELRKEERNHQSFCPDDDERTQRRRAPLEDPFKELALRFRERFGGGADAILHIVIDGIKSSPQEAREFLEFDSAHTGAPDDLTNPGGYYRTLVVKFQLAQTNRRERERLERQSEVERQLTAPPDPSPVCAIGKCNGRGEVYENGGLSVCECEAGQRLPAVVRETMALLRRGAA